jgi:hypothetical protein
MQMKKVTALRAFYFQRKLIAVGTPIELPSVFAIELIAANKAEAVAEVEKSSEPVSTSDTSHAHDQKDEGGKRRAK